MAQTPPEKPLPDIREDPRVQEMVSCLLFAINNLKNGCVFKTDGKTLGGWHEMFKDAITGAGYKLKFPKKPAKPKPAKKKGAK